MPYNHFIGNDNRIVRIQNNAMADDINELAINLDIPVQWVFNAVCSALLVGYVYGTKAFWNEVEYQAIAFYLKR